VCQQANSVAVRPASSVVVHSQESPDVIDWLSLTDSFSRTTKLPPGGDDSNMVTVYQAMLFNLTVNVT